MKFTYRSGQRPLDGYTLKRGVGQGGFGEVYFAVSDGGKEVALKLLKGHSDVELRGVANCLNMKHPNLVHVYDLKEDEHGDKWLVMEYVLGESMSAVLHRHPHGLPLNLVGEWFAALARAVAHLHDRGVVHRDLKPANIFIEAGTLKVGDYGLCKSISVSQKQTRTVGTVHYMAPEVSTGNYSQRIDIYACGVILHEMLTGKLPFDGESDGEILMKHLTATPDLSGVPEAFRPVLAKALDKNPLRRYGSVMEMAKAVEATVAQGAPPADVPVAAVAATAVPRGIPIVVARKPEPPTTPAAPPPLPVAVALAPPPKPPVVDNTPLPLARAVTWRDKVVSGLGSMLAAPLVALAGLAPYALIVNGTGQFDWMHLAKVFFVTTALSWAVLLGSCGASFAAADRWWRRLVLGALGLGVGVLAYWLGGWEPLRAGADGGSASSLDPGLFSVLYFGGVLAAGRWWRATARDRKERFGLFPVLAAAFWASVLLVLKFFWPENTGSAADGIVPAVLAVIAVQAVSPWTPPTPVSGPKKLRLRGA
ncbi:MAG: serine/threonine protein kinase [Fimbriiglobus sp.]|jgi:hypothetical protein|nr:serine/threonine protein kinase [Fimbriiglobus sp.]